MVQRPEQPYFMQMLAARGVAAGGFFRIRGRKEACYRVDGACVIHGLDGAAGSLTENEVWEALDDIEKISARQFREARQRYWEARRARAGKKTDAELLPLAKRFARAYTGEYGQGEWKALCALDEETLLRLVRMAARLGTADRQAQKKLLASMRADAIQARMALAAKRRAP